MVVSMDMAITQLPADPDSAPRPAQPIGYFDEQSGQWILAVAWVCELSDGRGLLVHPMARSDGASIPRFLWSVFSPRYDASSFPAAFCHDMLYQSELVTRSQADAEFHRLLGLFGVSPIKARLYWIAVRWFGGFVWARHTKASIAEARMFAEIIE